MALTFADTHNMIAYLTKSNTSEGFELILDFLNASVIKYALTVNPTIYVSCIKQFWSSVSLKKTNDVVRLQALIDRIKVIITKDTIRHILRLDDAESIDCLPNEEIFAELVRMGYEKPSTKLTFYKAFFSAQWKFLIHTILQCCTYFTSITTSISYCSTIITSTTTTTFTTYYHLHGSSQNIVGNMTTLTKRVENLEQDKIAQALEITKLKQRVRRLEKQNKLKASGGIIAKINADEDVTLEEVDAEKAAEVAKDAEALGRLEYAKKVLSMHDDEAEPAELKEVIEVVTTTKLMTEVVVAASTITTAPSAARRGKAVVIRDPEETATPSVIVNFKPKSKDKGKGILVEEPEPLKKQAQIEQDEAYAKELEVELNANINWNEVIEKVKRKEKQDNAVLRYQALKRKPQTKVQARRNMMHFNSIMAFLEKGEKELKKRQARQSRGKVKLLKRKQPKSRSLMKK
uniref:Xylulose kinase-1 n=1 Tax=Tanacetum cinerariifolium TaxID=118510 RepID=A0A699JH01_TANCI|nr:hypothetical protein [Tanacetum cinerariifolium]GFA34787.1 hypothetical protein [Tanacetum cinerariifolium]